MCGSPIHVYLQPRGSEIHIFACAGLRFDCIESKSCAAKTITLNIPQITLSIIYHLKHLHPILRILPDIKIKEVVIHNMIVFDIEK